MAKLTIDFEENGHTYLVNGEIASISVTELLNKHGLSPYSGANKSKMKQSADIGKAIHKDLENVFNKSNYEPTTPQGKEFAEWVKDNVNCGVGEQMLAYEYKGMIIAGTADVMAIGRDSSFIVGDHKNTSKFHREYVSWQVSLLDYFARKLKNEKVNGKLLKWRGADKMYCFHYSPQLTIYELEKIPDEEIERLIECEYKNEPYQRRMLVVDPELQKKFIQAEEFLAQVELNYKQAEQNAKKIREEMLSLFENQGIESWESPSGKIKVSYVRQCEKLSVDTARLKNEQPQIFTKYQKLTTTKPHIRVKIAEE